MAESTRTYHKPRGFHREHFVEAAVRNLVEWRLGDRSLDWLREAELLLGAAAQHPEMFQPARTA